jgi:hypothetical protein
MAGEETTTAVFIPRERDMRGPYLVARWKRASLGLLPKWNRFPTIGHPGGPGGSLQYVFLLHTSKAKNIKTEAIPVTEYHNSPPISIENYYRGGYLATMESKAKWKCT